MAEHSQSFWRPLIIIIALIILATSALAASNLSFSKARDFDPYLQTEQAISDNVTSDVNTLRTDVDGHLVLYVAELTSRWWHDAMSSPPFLPSGPFKNAVIAYPFDEEIYFSENYSLTFDWDATAADLVILPKEILKLLQLCLKPKVSQHTLL